MLDENLLFAGFSVDMTEETLMANNIPILW